MEKNFLISLRFMFAMAVIFGIGITARAAGKWDMAAGIRDTRYIFADVTFDSHAYLRAEHSVYSYDFIYQYWRLYAGGKLAVPYADFDINAFYGRTWCGNYYSAGALVSCRILPPGPVCIFGTLNPLYDSGFRYNTCFAAGLAVRLCKPVSLRASYTTIPEFRESEKAVRAGVDVHIGGLSVVPSCRFR